MLNLDMLKSDSHLLFELLRVDGPGNHKNCPFHEDRTGSMMIRERDGFWYWACKAGCGEGTFIDAFMLTHRMNKNEAFAEIEKQLGARFSKDEKKGSQGPPLIDLERAEKFVAYAHNNLLNDIDIQLKWVHGKRGLDIFTCERFGLGFVTNFCFERWPQWNLPAAWVLPVTNAAGELMAVKLHFEERPKLGDGKPGPKCLWCPFGVTKRSGYATLWPSPPPPQELYVAGVKQEQQWLYLCPGELKALAHIANDMIATSPTAGESQAIDEESMRRLLGHRIRIEYDNDEAGIKWRDMMAKKCESFAIEIQTLTLG